MDLNVEYVAKLARIKLTSEEEKKFSKDLGKILDYFKELQELNTENIKPLTGGTELKNAYREDDVEPRSKDASRFIEAFPDKEKSFLKVPPIFE